jgi:hypothetical protein
MQETCPLPVYYGFDYLDQLLEKRKAGEPFVFMDHAYFERGYDKGNFRILLNAVHQTDVIPHLPSDRLPQVKPWQEKRGSKVYVIPVAPNLAAWHDAHHWTTDTVSELKKHTDREIIVKPKNGVPLKDLLHDAWAVVSHSSVAAVESAQNGVPVFGPQTSPAFFVGNQFLDKIEAPSMLLRDEWLKTLSYSQFSIDEIRSGFAWATLKDIYGADYLRGT